ncbi:MAG: hypothetical protein AAFQ52_09175 [Chloroflexota bacterium]
MGVLRGIGTAIWRFMVIFSFIVNLVLVVVLLLAGLFIFQIKAQVADPLIGGLHSTAAGLDEATIDWVIPVRDSLGISLDVPINADTIISEVTQIGDTVIPPDQQIAGETVVRLTRPVPISISNAFIQSNDLTLRNATVDITLPEGTLLPVALDLAINLETDIPVDLDVRAVIPLGETQLADPIERLGLLFEPLAIGLHNLPNNFSEAGTFAAQVVGGEITADNAANVLLATDGTGFNANPYDPWTGFTQTAGVGYEDLMAQTYPTQSRPVDTGLVVPGGIPALDAALTDRAQYYVDDQTPASINAQVINTFGAQTAGAIPPYTYLGNMGDIYIGAQEGDFVRSPEDATMPPEGDGGTGGFDSQGAPDDTDSSDTNTGGSGIIPTPSSP